MQGFFDNLGEKFEFRNKRAVCGVNLPFFIVFGWGCVCWARRKRLKSGFLSIIFGTPIMKRGSVIRLSGGGSFVLIFLFSLSLDSKM